MSFKIIERNKERGWRTVKIKCVKCGYEYWEVESSIPARCKSDACEAARRRTWNELEKAWIGLNRW